MADSEGVDVVKPINRAATPVRADAGIPKGACTAETRQGTPCGKPSQERAPFPICAEHIVAVYRFVDRKMIATRVQMSQAAYPYRRGRRLNVHPAEGAGDAIYYLWSDGLIKIGYTGNLRVRMSQFSPGAVLLAVEPGDMAVEKERHDMFRSSKAARSEWFHPSEELLAHIETLAPH